VGGHPSGAKTKFFFGRVFHFFGSRCTISPVGECFSDGQILIHILTVGSLLTRVIIFMHKQNKVNKLENQHLS